MQNLIKLGALKVLRVGQLRASHGHPETWCTGAELPARTHAPQLERDTGGETARATVLRVPRKRLRITLSADAQLANPNHWPIQNITNSMPRYYPEAATFQVSRLIKNTGVHAHSRRWMHGIYSSNGRRVMTYSVNSPCRLPPVSTALQPRPLRGGSSWFTQTRLGPLRPGLQSLPMDVTITLLSRLQGVCVCARAYVFTHTRAEKCAKN